LNKTQNISFIDIVEKKLETMKMSIIAQLFIENSKNGENCKNFKFLRLFVFELSQKNKIDLLKADFA